jgi:hypothetical protein
MSWKTGVHSLRLYTKFCDFAFPRPHFDLELPETSSHLHVAPPIEWVKLGKACVYQAEGSQNTIVLIRRFIHEDEASLDGLEGMLSVIPKVAITRQEDAPFPLTKLKNSWVRAMPLSSR